MKMKLTEIAHAHVLTCQYCDSGVLRCIGVLEVVKGGFHSIAGVRRLRGAVAAGL